VRRATNEEYRELIENTSLFGYRGAKWKYVLVDKKSNEVVMTMGISKKLVTGKNNKKEEYEVVRSATKMDTVVVGGSSKLFKYAINDLNIDEITYFVDYDCHLGNSLEYMGFEFDKYTGPSSRNY
jgi:hypothetical protein